MTSAFFAPCGAFAKPKNHKIASFLETSAHSGPNAYSADPCTSPSLISSPKGVMGPNVPGRLMTLHGHVPETRTKIAEEKFDRALFAPCGAFARLKNHKMAPFQGASAHSVGSSAHTVDPCSPSLISSPKGVMGPNVPGRFVTLHGYVPDTRRTRCREGKMDNFFSAPCEVFAKPKNPKMAPFKGQVPMLLIVPILMVLLPTLSHFESQGSYGTECAGSIYDPARLRP